MSKAANLKTTQERIINMYLTEHFGSSVCASEVEIAAIGSDYVPYVQSTVELEGKKVDIFFRSPIDLLKKHSRTIMNETDNIDKIEL